MFDQTSIAFERQILFHSAVKGDKSADTMLFQRHQLQIKTASFLNQIRFYSLSQQEQKKETNFPI